MNLNNDPRGGTMCLSKAGLKIGNGSKLGTATAAPNGAGTDFAIAGVTYHLADSATDVPLTAATAQGLLTDCLYAICINASLARLSVKGTAVLSADLAAGNAVLQWPLPPAGYCCIGYLRVQTIAGANFTAGTTAIDANSSVLTYYDALTPPVDPLTA